MLPTGSTEVKTVELEELYSTLVAASYVQNQKNTHQRRKNTNKHLKISAQPTEKLEKNSAQKLKSKNIRLFPQTARAVSD